MRRVLACAGLLVPLLAGCGSSTTPALTLACTVHRLRLADRVQVTVTNTTGSPHRAIVYGPPLSAVQHVFPPHLLAPTTVQVTVGNQHRSYIGFLIPRVGPRRRVRALLRILPPAHLASILATTSRTVQASDWSVLDNSGCRIRPAR